MKAKDTGGKNREALTEALAELEELAQQGKIPTRHHARDLLLALGAEMRTGNSREIERAVEAVQRLAPASSPFGDRWRAAVAEEMALSCTEHVRSVDPKYIDHPRYDFEYTIEARERLELRLRAAEKLGVPTSEPWLAQVARADALLATRLERRSRGPKGKS
jgi:hypothetical protein